MKITEDRFKGVIIELPDVEIEDQFEEVLKKVFVQFVIKTECFIRT